METDAPLGITVQIFKGGGECDFVAELTEQMIPRVMIRGAAAKASPFRLTVDMSSANARVPTAGVVVVSVKNYAQPGGPTLTLTTREYDFGEPSRRDKRSRTPGMAQTENFWWTGEDAFASVRFNGQYGDAAENECLLRQVCVTLHLEKENVRAMLSPGEHQPSAPLLQ